MSSASFSAWTRWGGVLWLAVWVPTYWIVWGWPSFLRLCDIAVLLTCIGLWRSNTLLLSSQAVSSIVADAAWCVDVAWRLFLGRHLFGGTEYMWDKHFPLWVRLLSLYHVVLPALLIWSLRRVGYDQRGWKLQAGIAAVLFALSRFLDPAVNINFAFRDPIFHRAWGPAPVHLLVMWLGLNALLYWPTHFVFARYLGQPKRLPLQGTGTFQ